jgi:hypothetical protein
MGMLPVVVDVDEKSSIQDDVRKFRIPRLSYMFHNDLRKVSASPFLSKLTRLRSKRATRAIVTDMFISV